MTIIEEMRLVAANIKSGGSIGTAATIERWASDYAALEAERDELKRRLDGMLDRLPEGGVWCYTCNRASVPVVEQEPYEHIPLEYGQMKTIFLCPTCRRDGYAKDSCVSTLRAIAEGRDNG